MKPYAATRKLFNVFMFMSGILIMLILASCGSEPNPKQFSKVLYEGHTYIVYDGKDFDSGMVHDPDCICSPR